jgi:hypothetical protein
MKEDGYVLSKGFINFNHELCIVRHLHTLQNIIISLTEQELEIKLPIKKIIQHVYSMYNVTEIVSGIEVDAAFEGTNFGSKSNRDVVKGALLKCASGYHTGHTAKRILQELGLVNVNKWQLTKRGKEYLFAAYSNGVSV